MTDALPPPVDQATHFRVVATADWQIGMVGGGYRPEAAALLRKTRVQTIGTVLRLAKDVGARAVLAAGDLFEFPDQPQETAAAVAKLLNDHRDVPVHVIPGNHDLHGPGTVWTQSALHKTWQVHVTDDPVRLNAADATTPVTLWPLPVFSKYDGNPQQQRLNEVHETPGVHIVMAHGHDTSYLNFKHEECRLPIDSTAVIDKGYALLVLGHWHSWRQIGPRVVYPGTHEQTKFSERDAGNVAVIDVPLDGSEPTLHKLTTGKLRWRSETIDCTELALPDGLVERAREITVDADFVALTLTGDIALNDSLHALPRARAAINEMAEHLSWDDQSRELIDLDTAIDRYDLPQGLRQVQQALLQELIDAGDDREQVDVLRAELEVLYEVARDVGALSTEGA